MTALLEAPRRKGTHWVRWLIAVAVVLLVVIVVVHVLSAKKPTRPPQPQVVKVAQAVAGDMPETLSELGTVTPNATVTVLPQLSGYLTEVGYKEGQDVVKGQFLAQIDPRQYEIDLQQAEAAALKDQAALDQARSDLNRYEGLNQQKAIAEQTLFDQRFLVRQDEAQVKSDQAAIAQYKLDLVYCHITAPVSGRVGLRLVDPGNYVTASSSPGIVVITTIKPTTVQFTVAQNDLAKVAARVSSGAQLPVTAYTSDNSKAIETGTLYALSNQMTTSTGTVTLRATFANADEALFPNEFVNVKLLVDTLQNAVLVPTPALLNGAPGDYVYVVDPPGTKHEPKQGSSAAAKGKGETKGGKGEAESSADANSEAPSHSAKKKDGKGEDDGPPPDTVSVRKVTLGPSDGKNTAILSGLAVGETVVTDGTDRLTDGAEIRVAPLPGAAPAPGAESAGKGHGRHRSQAADATSSGDASTTSSAH
jgi:multidrug efflux system membrane fusion protein